MCGILSVRFTSITNWRLAHNDFWSMVRFRKTSSRNDILCILQSFIKYEWSMNGNYLLRCSSDSIVDVYISSSLNTGLSFIVMLPSNYYQITCGFHFLIRSYVAYFCVACEYVLYVFFCVLEIKYRLKLLAKSLRETYTLYICSRQLYKLRTKLITLVC